MHSLYLRVKIIIEEIERDEEALKEDLYSADRKFAEYYNVSSDFIIVWYIFFVLICKECESNLFADSFNVIKLSAVKLDMQLNLSCFSGLRANTWCAH